MIASEIRNLSVMLPGMHRPWVTLL